MLQKASSLLSVDSLASMRLRRASLQPRLGKAAPELAESNLILQMTGVSDEGSVSPCMPVEKLRACP